MSDILQSRIASVLLMAVGAWMVFLPLATSVAGAALYNLLAVGGVMMLAGMVQLFWRNTIPSIVIVLTSIWLFASAFLFSISDTAAWNLGIAAIAAFVLALWDGTEMGEVARQHHTHA